MGTRNVGSDLRKAIQSEVAEVGGEIFIWKMDLEKANIDIKPIDKRMEEVVRGIYMGVEPATAMTMCSVTESEFGSWMESPRNQGIYNKAIAYGDGLLEAILFKAAQHDPSYAKSALELRRKNRFKMVLPGKKARNVLDALLSED